MTYYDTWNQAFTHSFQDVWFRFTEFIPSLIGAIVVLMIGTLIAKAISKAVKNLVHYIHADDFIAKTGLLRKMKGRGWDLTPSVVLEWFTKWFLYLVVFIAVAQILRIDAVLDFFNRLILYIPNVLIAAIILVVGLVASEFVHTVVANAVRASRIPTSQAGKLGMIARVAIIVFATMAAMLQLGIAESLIQILFTGLIVSLSIAFGLAFGLGGQSAARLWIEQMQREMKDEHKQ